MLPLLLSHGNLQVLLSIDQLDFCATVLACKKHRSKAALMSCAVSPLQPAHDASKAAHLCCVVPNMKLQCRAKGRLPLPQPLCPAADSSLSQRQALGTDGDPFAAGGVQRHCGQVHW